MEAKTKVVVFEKKLWSNPRPTCVILLFITCPKTARWLLEELVAFRKKRNILRKKHNV